MSSCNWLLKCYVAGMYHKLAWRFIDGGADELAFQMIVARDPLEPSVACRGGHVHPGIDCSGWAGGLKCRQAQELELKNTILMIVQVLTVYRTFADDLVNVLMLDLGDIISFKSAAILLSGNVLDHALNQLNNVTRSVGSALWWRFHR